jgi:transcription elongation factor Elf1
MSVRIKEWNCVRCGYHMTAAHRVDAAEQVQPEEHDLALCMNCGALYEMRSGAWRLFTEAEVRQLEEKVQQFLKRKEEDRQRVIKQVGDLQIRQKFE